MTMGEGIAEFELRGKEVLELFNGSASEWGVNYRGRLLYPCWPDGLEGYEQLEEMIAFAKVVDKEGRE